MSRYSQLYIERGKPTQDSNRFRSRLAAVVELSEISKNAAMIIRLIMSEIGCEVPPQGNNPRTLAYFFKKSALRDVLDGVTVVLRVLVAKQETQSSARAWRDHVRRALVEENLAYRLGDDGIVHSFVDAEFEANRSAAIDALTDPRFSETKTDFDAAFRHLRNGEHKLAMRAMFPAVETAAKVLYPGRFAGLDVGEIKRDLLPRMRAKYNGNQPAITASLGLLQSFEKWIVASQQYRHGQEVQDATEAPQDLAVAHLSAGATFLRWMIEFST